MEKNQEGILMAVRKRGWLLGGLIASSIAGVVVYNYWAYCCGRCRMENFLTLGPYGKLLIGLNSLAAVAWMVIRWVRVRSGRNRLCSCGERRQSRWNFCPRCGRSVTTEKTGASAASPAVLKFPDPSL